MKIKTLVLLAALCFAIIPLVARVGLSQFFMRSDSLDRYEKEVTAMATNQVSGLQVLLDTANSDMNKVIGYMEKTDDFENYIMTFQNSNNLISAIRVIDSTGTIIVGEDNNKKGQPFENYEKYNDYADEALYFDAVSDNLRSSLFFKKHIDDRLVIISYNIAMSRSLLSVVVGNSRVDAPDNGKGKIVIVDSKGNWSNPGGMGFSSNFDQSFPGVNVSSVQDGRVYSLFKFNNQDAQNIGAAVRVGGENGLVAIAYCVEKPGGLFWSTSLPILIAAAAGLAILGVVLSIVASRKIAQPLNQIENTLEKIRRGDHEARIGNISNNEYGQLSRAFNNLVDEIVVSEDRYKTISDMSDNIIFEWNFKTNEVTFSNNFNKKFSYRPPSDHFGDSFLLKAKIHPDDADKYRADLDALEKGKDFERNEYRIKNIYGDFIWVLMRTSTIKNKENKPVKVVGVMVDIDRAKKSEEQLTERASFDALTELYNRETIEQKINAEISLSEMRKSEMAVLFIDVDDFKHYNDNYSHATGDQVLKFVGKTIREAVDNDVGFAGRFGGDEFVALVRNAETNSPAVIAQKLIDTMAAGFDADIGERLTVSVSIGIAVIKDDYNTRVEYLIGKADDAMYSVKKSGKSNYAFI